MSVIVGAKRKSDELKQPSSIQNACRQALQGRLIGKTIKKEDNLFSIFASELNKLNERKLLCVPADRKFTIEGLSRALDTYYESKNEQPSSDNEKNCKILAQLFRVRLELEAVGPKKDEELLQKLRREERVKKEDFWFSSFKEGDPQLPTLTLAFYEGRFAKIVPEKRPSKKHRQPEPRNNREKVVWNERMDSALFTYLEGKNPNVPATSKIWREAAKAVFEKTRVNVEGWQCYRRRRRELGRKGLQIKKRDNLMWSKDADKALIECIAKQKAEGVDLDWVEASKEVKAKAKLEAHPRQCSNRYLYINQDIVKGKFTEEEQTLLLSGLEKGLDMPTIARELFQGARSSHQLCDHLRRTTPKKNAGNWTREQDALLYMGYVEFGYKPNLIYEEMLKDIKTSQQIYPRLIVLSRWGVFSEVWIHDEDTTLIYAYLSYGEDFNAIEKEVFEETKTAIQCQKRLDYLKLTPLFEETKLEVEQELAKMTSQT